MLNQRIPRTMHFLFTFCLLVILMGFSACQATSVNVPSSTDNAQAESIVQGFIEAQNAGDVEGALAFLVDDAVIQLVPPPIEGDDGIFTGKEEIRAWYENLASLHGTGELSNVSVEGDQVTAILIYTDDSLKQIGVDSIDNQWVVTLQDDKIKDYTATLTEESLDKLIAEMAAAQAE